MEKKSRAIATNTTPETANPSIYAASLPTVPECKGCNKEFMHPDGERKCVAYFNPKAKWPSEGQMFATHTVMVRKRDANGKATSVDAEEIPILPKICPLASHVALPEIVKTSSKVHVGQGKTKQGGNR